MRHHDPRRSPTRSHRCRLFPAAPLALAAILAMGAGLYQPAHAQAVGGAGDAPAMAIAIAAQPLSQALAELARQTGTTLVAAPALLAGKTAPAVSGQLSARQALDRLLAGSGLIGSLDGGVIMVRQAPVAGREATLGAVTVTAEAERSGTTEGTGSYTTGSMSTATRLPLSIRETPQSVTVITRDRMEDQALVTASDVLRHTPGFSVHATAPNREEFFARGFGVGNVSIDGLTATGQWTRFGALINDMAI